MRENAVSPASKLDTSLAEDTAVVEVSRRHIAILELVASGARPYEIFHALTDFIESHDSGLTASIFSKSVDGTSLHYLSAPNLPLDYVKATDGVRIGEGVGSCGTAAHRGEAVYCNDIRNDELWTDYRDLAEASGMASCWSTPVKDLDGQVLGTIAIYRGQKGGPSVRHQQLLDFSTHIASLVMGRHRADEALRLSEQKFGTMFQNSPDAIMLTTFEEGRIVEANQGCKRMFGVSPAALTGRTLNELQLCTDQQQAEELREILLRHGRVENFQFDICNSGGEQRTALISAEVIVLRDGPHVIKVCRDITRQLQAELELKRNQERLKRAQQLGKIGDWSIQVPSGRITWSDEMYRIHDRDHEEKLTLPKVQSWVHEEDLPKVKGFLAMLYALKPGEAAPNLEYRIVRRSGEVRWVEVAPGAVFDPQGNMIELCGTALDISARKTSEQATRKAAVAAALVATLTPRQKEVLKLVADGVPNKAIAGRLNISDKTVEKHRAIVMKKLQVHSVPELVRVALSAEMRRLMPAQT